MYPPSKQVNLREDTIEELRNISDAVRNLAGCMPHCVDDDTIKDIFDDLCAIWFELEKVLRKEQTLSIHVEEELRKFQEGFAYQPRPCGECSC